MLLFAALLAINVRIIDSAPITPENITLTFISPTSVKVSWETSPVINQQKPLPEKYDISYKPANARIVLVVAGNSKAVILGNLVPDTQYTLTVTAIYKSKRYRSRPVTFKTQELTGTNHQQDSSYIITPHTMDYPVPPSYSEPGGPTVNNVYREDTNNFSRNITSATRELPTIRGVEIGIVLLVLFVWAGAIALFFNRWGKIRMLLPYQPDYKSEQLKVPGTGVCTGQCNGQHSHQQQMHPPWPEDSVVAIENRCSRARINSAIFVSSEGKGFDSIEFIRRYGSQSVLCRKAKSAENINDEKKAPFQRHIFDVIQQARQHARRQSEFGLQGHYRTRKLSSKDWSTEDHQSPPIELQECTISETAENVDNNSKQDTSSSNVTNNKQLSLPLQQKLSPLSLPPLNLCQPSTSKQQHRAPLLGQLPALSVSGPSPPHEQEQLL